MDIINWLNDNSGFVMAVLTFVYVIATIIICIFNYKSAKATNDQTRESYKQFIENSRARVIPMIIVSGGNKICLGFKNIGKNIATNVVINVDEKWLKLLDQTKTFPVSAEKLRTLKDEKIFLTVDQQILYGLYIPGNGENDYEILTKKKMIIDITYTTMDTNYKEHYEIPISGYNFLLETSDYVRLTERQIEETKITNNQLKKINENLKEKNNNQC